MHILYADDDPEDISTFCEIMEAIDAEIICQTVPDGIDVVSFLEDAIMLPDLIFLDINMPLMNGKECLVKLKESKMLKSIPVVIYTTSNRKTDYEETMKAGAVEYLVKANTFAEAYKVLYKTIQKYR